MQFTTQQAQALKAYIVADPVLSTKISGPGTDYQFVAGALNTAASPAFPVWRSTTPVDEIADAVIWANMTPAAAPDGTQLWANRSLQCQGKQFNLQNLLIGKSAVASAKANIRAAFQDCLTALPSKSDGTNQAAGWTAVQAAMQRPATVAEKVLAKNQNNPADLGWEGQVNTLEIGEILAS